MSRIAYAAAHVVADPGGDNGPGRPARVDWDGTLRFRRHLWGLGLRVADAMDTAQRNMGLDWTACRELIRRSAAAAREFGDPAELVVCGAGTDHAAGITGLGSIHDAYTEQIETIRDTGAGVVVMASRQLASLASTPDDYLRVYGKLLAQVDRPVILHWLGEMFDPNLRGYWGSEDIGTATRTLIELIRAYASRVDGVKVSLLDAEHEIRLRDALPDGVRLYTGDDFNYPELIKSGSHALLGIFDAIAPAAASAMRALDEGALDEYDAILAPTVPLARKLFEPPTYHYKTGIVFLAWLAGHQDHFTMVNAAQAARPIDHLSTVYELAGKAGLLPDPDLAAARMAVLNKVYGQ